MRHVYDVLRLTWTAGLSERQIAQSLGLSRPTMANHVHRAQEVDLSWPLPEGLDEATLETLLFPPPAAKGTLAHLAPDWASVHQQVSTTLATTSDFVMEAPIEQDLAERDLLPGTHLIDSGYVVAGLLVSAPRDHHINVVGPALSSSSRQGREGQGYDVHSFAIDWEARQASCLQGHRSVKWTPGHSQEGHDVIRIRFDKATCDACAVRPACTSSTKYPRQITVKPQALHEAIRAAHERQATAEFKEQYALRAGVESTISQGARRFDLRRSRYIDLTKTHLQQTINATAMNLVCLAAWLRKGSVDQPKRRPGHFARLAPPPLFGLAACEASTTPS